MSDLNYSVRFMNQNKSIFIYAFEYGAYHFHWHSEFEIVVILKGPIEICAGGVSRILNENDIGVVNPNEGHVTLAKVANASGIVVRIPSEIIYNFLPEGQHIYLNCFSTEETRNRMDFCCIRYCIVKMIECLHYNDKGYMFSFFSYIFMLLYWLLKSYSRLDSVENCCNNNPQDVNKIVCYINKHYKEKIKLSDLAQYTGYHPTYISQLINKHLGITFHDYLTRIRLAKATQELKNKSKNISEAALDSGFSDIKSFNRTFKITYSKTPSQYRRELNSEILNADEYYKKDYLDEHSQIVKNHFSNYINQYHNAIVTEYKDREPEKKLLNDMNKEFVLLKNVKNDFDALEQCMNDELHKIQNH